FGTNATQTATTLTITKADLATVGLSASANNSAESLYVAMLLLAKNYLTDANLTSNTEQSISIVDSFDSLVTRGTNQYRQKTYSVNLQKLDTGSTIDPDDY
ncbi:MAG TPA: hypothetical protein DEV81_10590, partial [Cyanobacteria bacterium UBA11049]|nr:hypothetical protein [Cyanobacteria bacterium UBA11049]